MKMLAEYVENAIKFEQMAADEKDPKLKAEFGKQAAAYRKLAEKRAKEYGLTMPSEQRQDGLICCAWTGTSPATANYSQKTLTATTNYSQKR